VCRALATARRAEEPIEDLSKLGVEDGVDDGVECAVDVAEPDEARQHEWVDMTQCRRAGVGHVVTGVLAYTHSVDDVDGEERQPAEQKHRYTHAHTQPLLLATLTFCTSSSLSSSIELLSLCGSVHIAVNPLKSQSVRSRRYIIIDFPNPGITYNGGWCSATMTR